MHADTFNPNGMLHALEIEPTLGTVYNVQFPLGLQFLKCCRGLFPVFQEAQQSIEMNELLCLWKTGISYPHRCKPRLNACLE